MEALKPVPGKFGYPVVGETSLEFYKDPVKFVESRNAQHSSKAFLVRFLNNPTIFLSDPLCVKELLASEKSSHFSYGYKAFLHRVFGDNILFEEADNACYLHSCLSSLFTNTGLYRDAIESILEPFLQALTTSNDAVAIYEESKHFATHLCLRLFLGLDPSNDLVKNISQLATKHWHGIISVPVNLRVPLAGSSNFGQAMEAKAQLLEIIGEVLSKHSNSGSTNQSMLHEIMKRDFPGSKDVEQHLLLFVSALIPKALSSIITSFVVATAGPEKKEMRAKALNDDLFLKDILLEVQRLWPPFFGGRRLALKDTSLGGYKIPKGYAVVYLSQVSQRDSSIFPDANKFLPDRWSSWNAGHRDLVFCFGAGPRSCVGRLFIDDVLRDVTRRLLDAYDWILQPDDQDLTYKFLPVARPAKPAAVAFCRRL